jgi:hypothetical protein
MQLLVQARAAPQCEYLPTLLSSDTTIGTGAAESDDPPHQDLPCIFEPELNPEYRYSSCFTWPAVGCDSYYNHSDINGYNGTNPFLHPGALLAVPPSHASRVASSLSTSIGHKLLAALTVCCCCDLGVLALADVGVL